MKPAIALVILVIGFVAGQGTDCSSKVIAMDKAVEKALLLTNPNLRPFTDIEDFRQFYCDHFLDWVKTITSYRSCLKSFQKTVFGVITSNMKKNYKTICLKDSELEKIVRHSKCFINDNKATLQLQVQKLTGIVEYVADRPNPDDMIPGLCCGFQLLANLVEHEVDSICNATTAGFRTGQFFKYVIESNISDAMDIMCGNFDSLQVCQQKSPARMEELRTVIEASNTVYNHTAFVSLLRFIERMDSTVNVQ